MSLSSSIFSALFLLSGLFANLAFSEPFLPENDEHVLSKVENGVGIKESQTIESLRLALGVDANNQDVAFQLANAYLSVAKKQNDPRYYGLAEAVIKPWWVDSNSDQILMLKAKILQFNHQFTEAIQVLSELLDIRLNLQALLMRASIYQIIGEYDAARRDCAKLGLQTSALITTGCFFSVSGFTSSAEKTRTLIDQLKNMLDMSSGESLETKLWIIGLMAESASLIHEWKTAEEFMIFGLEMKSDDGYLLSLYADLLLKQSRYQKCISLLNKYARQTSLFVRLLVAKNQLYIIKNKSQQQIDLELRIREDSIKGDEQHLREYAYYQLYVQKNYNEALRNALINWENQKEMTDALILYRAAEKMQKNSVLTMLHDWAKINKVQINFSTESLKV